MLFWDLTPRECMTIAAGVRKRLRQEHNDRMLMAWQIAAIPNSKQKIRLRDLLVEVEDNPRPKDWRQLKAALLWAMPPKGSG